MPKSRHDAKQQIDRLLWLIRELDRREGISTGSLANECGVSSRSIQRDLLVLQSAGLPLVCVQDGRRKLWRLEFTDKLQKVASLLDASHYLALHMAMSDQALRGSTASLSALEDLAERVQQALGPAMRAKLKNIAGAFVDHSRAAYRDLAADLLWPLIEAIGQNRLCQLDYRSAKINAQFRWRTVLPRKLFVQDGALYLLCEMDDHENTLSTLNLQRARGLKLLDQQREPSPQADVEYWQKSAFRLLGGGEPTDYHLKFAPHVAGFIKERQWLAGQQLEDLPDGGVELRFRCAETYEIMVWVASWRDGVRVLQPQSLRDELAGLGAFYRDQYGN